MKRFVLQLCLFILFPLYGMPEEPARPWEVKEFRFSSMHTLSNPYLESLQEGYSPYLTATFETEGEEANSMTIPGFWDGETAWVVRFAPPSTGTWTYTTSSQDASLDHKTGSFKCIAWTEEELVENPTRRGFVQVNPNPPLEGRYFAYQDGTPFLWIGDTWWNWSKRGIHLDSFKKLADDRARKNFTVGQLFFAGRGWGRSASLLNEDYSQPDIDHIHHIENYIRYANEKGITVWIHGWWGSNEIDKTIGGENIRRWWRYAVHRLHAYNVIWVLAGEYNLYNYGGFELEFWKDLGRLIKNEDPYNRIVSVHPTPPGWGGGADAPQWSTAEVLHSEDWLDYNQSQVGHGKWRNEMIPKVVTESYQTKPPKPIVVTEPWYEFILGNPTAEDIRFGAWSAFLSGAAGHSYAGGHVWKAHVPEAPQGEDSWPMDLGFETNTLDYPGAQSMSFMSTFLQNTGWWKLEPHPDYVIDNPSAYCKANPGHEYLLYLRFGGVVKVDLTDASSSTTFTSQWVDLTNTNNPKIQKVSGGDFVVFYPPESYPGLERPKDWLLWIKRSES